MTTAAATPSRELQSLTADVERRLLLALAARVPARIGPDHLTAVGFAGMLLAGAAYAFSARTPALLLAVNAALALNWLGDSLDGTLARYRNRQRPRYGFYVDHVVDAFGAVALLLGLAASGRMAPLLAIGLLLAYLVFSVHIALAACTRGRFKISYGALGGTELRLLLVLANTIVWAVPRVELAGRSILLFDVVGAAALVALVAVLLRAVVQSARALAQEERL
jgi:phosphatidylglycerophosphate synthase